MSQYKRYHAKTDNQFKRLDISYSSLSARHEITGHGQLYREAIVAVNSIHQYIPTIEFWDSLKNTFMQQSPNLLFTSRIKPSEVQQKATTIPLVTMGLFYTEVYAKKHKLSCESLIKPLNEIARLFYP